MRNPAVDGQRCPGPEALARGLRRGEPHPDQAHLARCAACARAVDELTALLELARALPARPESGEDREERRTQLLALAAATPVRVRRRPGPIMVAGFGFAFALAAAAALVALIGRRAGTTTARPATAVAPLVASLSPPTPGAIRRATVSPAPSTSFAFARDQPDELVRLRDGTLWVEVAPLRPGERFRVLTGDAEVEVRGTAFEVVAVADRLLAVRVEHGTVEIRRTDQALVTLTAGQRWPETRSGVIAAEALAPRSGTHEAPARPTPRGVRVRPPVNEPLLPPAPAAASSPVLSPSELALQDGIAALHADDAVAATTAFARALAADAAGPLAEDSRFWLAVARARGGQRAGAIRAFEDFLALHPRSPRAGKASAMLGWLLIESQDLDGARRRFEAAVDDLAADVRASAQAGLAEVTRRRP